MSFRISFHFVTITLLTSCVSMSNTKNVSSTDMSLLKEYKTLSFNCDSIYKNKNYHLELRSIKPIQEKNETAEYVFLITKMLNKQIKEIIYKDTIQSRTQEVLFLDYNNDNIKDILIQNTSSARSNQTYNLYLVDTDKDEIKKVKGFNTIPNPNYVTKYDLNSLCI